MTGGEWRPLGLDDTAAEEYEVLVDGVPPWMKESLLRWIVEQIPKYAGERDAVTVSQIENECRIRLGASADRAWVLERVILDRLRSKPDIEVLRVADWLLARTRTVHSGNALEAVLVAGRSRWTVGTRGGYRGLVERVPEGVRVAVEGVIAEREAAGRLLARAWSDIHGLEPDPSSAYALAVRAVEAAAIAVVLPKMNDATLGTVLGQMKADGDWRLPLREHQDAPGAEMLLAMIRTLWYGHRDRHGTVNYSDVTAEEARAAVMLAATLVEWFASGAVARRSPQEAPQQAAP